MSKITSSSKDELGYGYSFVIAEHQRDYMKGRLCTLLESFGLKDSQEKAAKDIIKQEVDSWFYPNALGISSQLSTAVHNIVHRIQESYKADGMNNVPTPSGGYGFEFEIIATSK